MRSGLPPPSVAVAPLLVVAALGVDLATEHVEAVAHMEHSVAVDTVVAGVAAAGGADPPLVVGLLAEEVVDVEGHDEGLALEEGFRQLAVPDELVGVHRRVVVAPTAVLAQVAAQLEAHGQAQQELSAVAELPGVEVGIGLQLVAGVLIVDVAVERHLEPVVAEAGIEALAQVGRAGGVFLGVAVGPGHVVDVVVVAQAGVGAHVPVGGAVQCGVEGESAVGVPVAVDVLGP